MTLPAKAAFAPAAETTAAFARSIAPGPNTKANTHFVPTGETTGELKADIPDAAAVLGGTRAGIRVTQGWFVIPGTTHVVQSIDHPGTPPHPYLRIAAAQFKSIYVKVAQGLMHLGL